MAQPLPPFVEHCLELLSPLGAVRARRMFGGWGIYADDCFVAIVAFDRLYLKAGAEGRAAFEQAGCEPFTYDAKAGSVALGYWSAPADAMDSPALMAPWARLALQAALTARAVKSLKPPKPPKPFKSPAPAAKARRRGA